MEESHPQTTQLGTPTKIHPQNDLEMLLGWSNGDQYVVPYFELRLLCPCAHCVDEHTGKRKITREQIKPTIKVMLVELVGRYAVKILFNDGHSTGIYHFDTLKDICLSKGRLIQAYA